MKSLILTAPEPVTIVSPQAASGLIVIDARQRLEIEGKVARFVDDLISMPTASPEFNERVEGLSSLGQKEIREASRPSNRFLDKPIREMGGETGIGAELMRLRRIIEDLDPDRHGNLLAPRNLLGVIPIGFRIKAYFNRYAPTEKHIAASLRALASSKDKLLQDNAAVDGEKRRLWKAMERLEYIAIMAAALDDAIETRARSLDNVDPDKAKALRENAAVHVRQRRHDLLTQMAATAQNCLALDLVKQNNAEIAKAVDRVAKATIAALRTAVSAAQALGRQRLVLKRIGELNAAAGGAIENDGRTSGRSSARINDEADSAAANVEMLKTAFRDLYETMAAIDGFKEKAPESMRATAEALAAGTGKAKSLERTENRLALQ